MQVGWVLGLAFCLVATAQNAYGQLRGHRAERFDVNIEIRRDGSLSVEETVPVFLSGQAFQRVTQEISQDRTDGVQIEAVKVNGRILSWGRNSGQAEVRRRRQLEVIWHFEPAVNKVLVFGLNYIVRGAVRRKADCDELFFRPLPYDHEYPIEASTITLAIPPGAVLLDSAEVFPARARIHATGHHYFCS